MFGLFGICKKNWELLCFLQYGMIAMFFYIISVESYIFIIEKKEEKKNNYLFKFIYYYNFPILLLYSLLIVSFTYIFMTIYKDELENFLN
jgi:hypothetical protein